MSLEDRKAGRTYLRASTRYERDVLGLGNIVQAYTNEKGGPMDGDARKQPAPAGTDRPMPINPHLGGEARATDGCAEDRNHRDAREAIDALVRERREDFNFRLEEVLRRLAVFGRVCSNALGTISRSEAIAALKREAEELLDRMG